MDSLFPTHKSAHRRFSRASSPLPVFRWTAVGALTRCRYEQLELQLYYRHI